MVTAPSAVNVVVPESRVSATVVTSSLRTAAGELATVAFGSPSASRIAVTSEPLEMLRSPVACRTLSVTMTLAVESMVTTAMGVDVLTVVVAWADRSIVPPRMVAPVSVIVAVGEVSTVVRARTTVPAVSPEAMAVSLTDPSVAPPVVSMVTPLTVICSAVTSRASPGIVMLVSKVTVSTPPRPSTTREVRVLVGSETLSKVDPETVRVVALMEMWMVSLPAVPVMVT